MGPSIFDSKQVGLTEHEKVNSIVCSHVEFVNKIECLFPPILNEVNDKEKKTRPDTRPTSSRWRVGRRSM